MSAPRQISVHMIGLATVGIVITVGGAILSFQTLAAIARNYHTFAVIGFMVAVAVWTYWVVYALIRRSVDRGGAES